jgi:hypothetical protein
MDVDDNQLLVWRGPDFISQREDRSARAAARRRSRA